MLQGVCVSVCVRVSVCVCVRTSVGYGRFGEQDDDILLKRPTIRLICRYSGPEYIKSVCSITIYEYIYIYIYILSVYVWLYGQMEPYTIQGAKLFGGLGKEERSRGPRVKGLRFRV